MNKSNIQTNKKQTKNVSLYATISVMVAFALVSSPLIIGTDVYAVQPQSPLPGGVGCNPQTDTDCFPRDHIIFGPKDKQDNQKDNSCNKQELLCIANKDATIVCTTDVYRCD
ncbi:MAG: hypothetical protein AB7U98_12110 [Candidatus Nitrosocosmicus sp.]